MDIIEKVKILSDAAKYDVSCSSSGSSRANTKGGIGNAAESGICHSWADDGRCISLLKILYTNNCIYDCAYCHNRRGNDIKRAKFTVEEICELTINFYRRNYIEGLFLSSGVFSSPDRTMEEILQVVKKLREEYHFNGYIHIKAIPGASQELIYQAGLYADRMSVNIELPSEQSLKLLAPEKKRVDIIKPMQFIGSQCSNYEEEKKKRYHKIPKFVPAGHTTQMIVGASQETDYQIVSLMESMYQKLNLKRIYYSAYIPVNKDNRLPVISAPPLIKENRLYQADWLLRFYKFKADEILNSENPFLDDELDPKTAWAIRNPHFFPLEINKASYEEILRIPGIGVKSALRIVYSRRAVSLTFDTLKKIGVVMKRAKFFILCQGKYLEQFDVENIRPLLLPESIITKKGKNDPNQLKLF